ncbi:MAG: hypothetical protein IPG68_02800 [Micrococcales bacterium]|nr:hypothetical protein [Micrococcales bacterium]
MKWVVLAIVALVLDRLLLAAERRGWIYYRKLKPTSGSASAAAFGPMAEIFQPGHQVVVEERQRQENVRRTTEDGAPPRP